MSFLDFTGLQYFYNKYLKPIKPHAREETIKSYTVNEQGHVPDAQLVAQLKEENERLQEEVDKLNSSLGKLHFFKQEFSDVETVYDDNNRIRFNGNTINAETYPSSVWLIILNSTETTGAGSIFLALIGKEIPNTKIIELGKNSGVYPLLQATSASGLLYVTWSGTRNAYIGANVFKLS